jgi:hypothetical protein
VLLHCPLEEQEHCVGVAALTGRGLCSELIDGMSIRELRAYLSSKGVSTTGFLEKTEFVSAAKATL